MPPYALGAATFGALLAIASAANATVGCSTVSPIKGATTVTLFAAPDDTAKSLREIPLGDIVEYPQADLAPAQAEGWAWVRHDITQTTLWQTGDYGWLRLENIADCG